MRPSSGATHVQVVFLPAGPAAESVFGGSLPPACPGSKRRYHTLTISSRGRPGTKDPGVNGPPDRATQCRSGTAPLAATASGAAVRAEPPRCMQLPVRRAPRRPHPAATGRQATIQGSTCLHDAKLARRSAGTHRAGRQSRSSSKTTAGSWNPPGRPGSRTARLTTARKRPVSRRSQSPNQDYEGCRLDS
jgi:hypothetical protein